MSKKYYEVDVENSVKVEELLSENNIDFSVENDPLKFVYDQFLTDYETYTTNEAHKEILKDITNRFDVLDAFYNNWEIISDETNSIMHDGFTTILDEFVEDGK